MAHLYIIYNAIVNDDKLRLNEFNKKKWLICILYILYEDDIKLFITETTFINFFIKNI